MNILSFSAQESGEQLFESTTSVITVGRGGDNLFVLEQSPVSRRHAKIFAVGKEWCIKDLGSTNGTTINGINLQPDEPSVFREGDIIGFGSYLLKVSGSRSEKRDPTILVFRKNEYEGAFTISTTTDFVLGGPQATIGDESVSAETATLILSREGENIIVRPNSTSIEIYIDGARQYNVSQVKDRSCLRVGNYRIVASYFASDMASEDLTGGESGSSGEMPDFLKERIGDQSWDDPLDIKRKHSPELAQRPGFSQVATDSSTYATASAIGREELGAKRFTRPNLQAVKNKQEAWEKRQAVYGACTVVILLGMGLILLTLYGGLFI